MYKIVKKESLNPTVTLMEVEAPLVARKSCHNPGDVCVCGHARQVMYISAEGRTLLCMALSGMDIQQQFPCLTESSLEECLSDSSYMRFIETRASEVLAHNQMCQECEHAAKCLGGCRASALETTPEDLLGRDLATCALFKDGWEQKITQLMETIRPSAQW